MTAEGLARRFHETYERLAPSFGYETRPDSKCPWEMVPDANRSLMVAVCQELLDEASERAGIVRYLEHCAAMEVGSILGRESREIVSFCASWVYNRLDEKWAAELAATKAAADAARDPR